MESIFEAINEWLKELLIGAINGNLSNMFGDVNEKVGTIAAQAGQTPQGWNGGVFSMIQNLSQTVILSDGKLMETQTANYFSDIYPIDCAVLSANAQSSPKCCTLLSVLFSV